MEAMFIYSNPTSPNINELLYIECTTKSCKKKNSIAIAALFF